jgi:dimethylsulfone monooxygenase
MIKNKFNIGLFAFNASNGVTITKSKKRWQPTWKKIRNICSMAEKNKLDFLLPVARWNDWGGHTRPHKETFETFSLMSSIAAITKKIYIFSTIHTSFVHPIFAARATTSIDNISNSRFGVNIVCGWNKSEYKMFNVNSNYSSVERYKYGNEWLRIYKKLINKKSDKISFKGEFFKVENAQCFPKIIDQKKFLTISAAFSEKGRKFATKNCDILLTMFSSLKTLKKNNTDIIENARKFNNKIKIFSPIHIICKKSRSEALDFYEQYSLKNQDTKAVNNFIGNLEWSKKNMLAAYLKQVKQTIAGSLGGYTIVGNPKDVIEKLEIIKKSKVSGIALTFFDYEKDLLFFSKKILPTVRRF